ncbi:MAG: small multi-drug export protein [Clostridia bacterium]
MTDTIVEFFRSVTNNDYLTLFLISIVPIIELRGAIVIMSGMVGINEIAGMFCCIAGSTTVILPLLLATRPLIRKLKKSRMFSKFGKKIEDNLADRASTVKIKKIEDIDEAYAGERNKKKRKLSQDAKKFLGLFVFVAVPLPLTGAWTGSCVGSFLDFPIWKAALAVFLGNIIAACILTVIAIFLPKQYVDFFLYGFVVLAIAIAISLYFARSKRMEKNQKEALAKFSNKNEYELDILVKEAKESGKSLVKKEYIDENGDKHIVIGRDASKNTKAVKDDTVI